jgi:hypothetical protein
MSESPEPVESESDSDSDGRSFSFGLSSRLAFAIVLLAGVALPGYFTYLLASANYSTLASAVWVLGYGTAMVVIWYVWLRPLDLVGSNETDERMWGDETADDSSESVSDESPETGDESTDFTIQESTDGESIESSDHPTDHSHASEDHNKT